MQQFINDLHSGELHRELHFGKEEEQKTAEGDGSNERVNEIVDNFVQFDTQVTPRQKDEETKDHEENENEIENEVDKNRNDKIV